MRVKPNPRHIVDRLRRGIDHLTSADVDEAADEILQLAWELETARAENVTAREIILALEARVQEAPDVPSLPCPAMDSEIRQS